MLLMVRVSVQIRKIDGSVFSLEDIDTDSNVAGLKELIGTLSYSLNVLSF